MRNRGSIRHNGGDLSFESVGVGPAVVFIHGFALDRRVWRSQLDVLSASYRVITYDCRGFGRSSAPTLAYDHADDLVVLLRHLGIDSVHLVGLSMGGRIAVNVALRVPAMVRTLAVIASDLGGYQHQIDWNVPVVGGDLDAARAFWLGHALFDSVRGHPAAWTLTRAMVADYSGWHWLHEDIRHPADLDAIDRLTEVSTRAIAIVGDRDLPDFQTIADLLVARIPHARKVMIKRAGHLVNLESPTACTEILRHHFAGER